MTLSNTPAADLTFDRLDAFLNLKRREGPMLDYKAEVPNDLAKLVSAFANTFGGQVILGVEHDPKTNEPIWPPVAGGRGMKADKGIPDRVEAICRDGIEPPILPELSGVIPNAYNPGNVLLVVRVPESPEAPHITHDGRHVYERTGASDKPRNATLDRIRELLDRRRSAEAIRDGLPAEDMARAMRYLTLARAEWAQVGQIQIRPPSPEIRLRTIPIRWVAVSPLYPTRGLCGPDDCFRLLHAHTAMNSYQRIPGGGFGQAIERLVQPGYPAHCCGIGFRGNCFFAQIATDVVIDALNSADLRRSSNLPMPPDPDRWLDYAESDQFLACSLESARCFFHAPSVEKPGFLAISFGVLDAIGMRMNFSGSRSQGGRFVDEHFRADTTVPAHSFLTDPMPTRRAILTEMAFGFDLPTDVIKKIGQG